MLTKLHKYISDFITTVVKKCPIYSDIKIDQVQTGSRILQLSWITVILDRL